MSLYTTEVRFICETLAGYDASQGYQKVNEIVNMAASGIFEDTIPFFDENYRGVLETKILKHYYTREIGFETVGLWIMKLNNKMNEIMPFYNKLYSSELLNFNPLYTVNLKKTYDKSGNEVSSTAGNENEKVEGNEQGTSDKTKVNNVTENGNKTNSGSESIEREKTGGETNESVYLENNSTDRNGQSSGTANLNENTTNNQNDVTTNNGTTTSDAWNKFSDTPQGALTNIANGSYLTNATENTNNGTTQNSEVSNTSGDTSRANTETGTTNETESTLANRVGNSNDTKTNNENEEISNTKTGNETSSNQKIGNENENIVDQKIRENERTKSDSRTSDKNNFENYLESVQGWNNKSPSKLLQEFRETFLNIDMMVIDELADLFMGLWA